MRGATHDAGSKRAARGRDPPRLNGTAAAGPPGAPPPPREAGPSGEGAERHDRRDATAPRAGPSEREEAARPLGSPRAPRRRRQRGGSPPPAAAEGGRHVFFFPDTARDEHLPLAAVERVMRRALPAGARVSAGAKAAVQEGATAFIRAVTAEAYGRAVRRGTAEARGVTGEDVVFAVAGLGFAGMAEEVPERESPGRFSRVRYHVSPRSGAALRSRLTDRRSPFSPGPQMRGPLKELLDRLLRATGEGTADGDQGPPSRSAALPAC